MWKRVRGRGFSCRRSAFAEGFCTAPEDQSEMFAESEIVHACPPRLFVTCRVVGAYDRLREAMCSKLLLFL